MQDLEQLRRFYTSQHSRSTTLYDIWERGDAWGDSVTPATSCPGYRAWMVEKLRGLSTPPGTRCVLSVGCGNAAIEAELHQDGIPLLALDILEPAVRLARRKGVHAVVADATTWDPTGATWDVIYADGFLGHVYEHGAGCLGTLGRFRDWLTPNGGAVVISNDAPPLGSNVLSADGVAGFYWLSAGFIASQLQLCGIEVVACEEYWYERPQSGMRRRVVVTGRRDAT